VVTQNHNIKSQCNSHTYEITKFEVSKIHGFYSMLHEQSSLSLIQKLCVEGSTSWFQLQKWVLGEYHYVQNVCMFWSISLYFLFTVCGRCTEMDGWS